MGGGSGGGGKSGRGGGGGGSPTNYTVSKAEYLPGFFEGGSEKTGIELIQVKSGQWTYGEGRMLTHYQKQISEGKMNINPSNRAWAGMRYHPTREDALNEARKLNDMSMRERRKWEESH